MQVSLGPITCLTSPAGKIGQSLLGYRLPNTSLTWYTGLRPVYIEAVFLC